jgi:hypothetical protein
MLERLKEGFGFKAIGRITPEDVKAVEPQIRIEISNHHKHPIGILFDFSDCRVEGALGRDALPLQVWRTIARVAIIGARKREELMGDIAGATVLMQADIRYFHPAEIMHAWQWVKTAKYAEGLHVRMMLPPGHVMSGYNPEYTDL